MRILFVLTMVFLYCSCQQPMTVEEESTAASSWAFPYFEKADSINPILSPGAELTFTDPITQQSLRWEERNVLNPTAVVKDDKVYLLYRAQDSLGTSRIGMAISSDGLHFEKQPTPVFFPDRDEMKIYEWNYQKDESQEVDPTSCISCYFDGVEDPRIIESEDGKYFMTYTSYDGKTARLSIASSPDLKDWTKHGLVLKGEKYQDQWAKAGAIVAERQGSSMVAKKIQGKYWMYFGDTNIFLATSDDLVHWEAAENEESGKVISVLHPRMGYFDSRLVESGPFALYTEEGIVLIYNASNAANFNDPTLPKFTYAAGQALFAQDAPYQLIDRMPNHFIYPDKDYEKVGEVNEVCFVEGLVYFHDKWFLYYGTADSKIAVAVYEPGGGL